MPVMSLALLKDKKEKMIYNSAAISCQMDSRAACGFLCTV